MRVIMAEVIRRIGRLLRLLSSPHAGEAGAAAQALTRTLASAGLDIHALAKTVEDGLKVPAEQPAQRDQQAARTTHRRPGGGPLVIWQGLVCDATNGLFRPCGCGGILFTVMPGVGPHAAQLICDECGRGGRWLGRHHFQDSS
jgi:hypothetical protein